jgi:uncharacterized protein involved in outer membrane biogenesis
MRKLKKLLKFSVITVIFIVITATYLVLNTDLELVKRSLLDEVRDKTGRELVIDGDIMLVPSLTPALTATGVSLSNSDWGSQPLMFNVGRIEARISLASLLTGTVHIERFILEDTAINLEKKRDGSGNWVWNTDNKAPSEQVIEQGLRNAILFMLMPSVLIDEVQIKNARIVYREHRTGNISRIAISDFSTSSPRMDDPMDFSLTLAYNNIPMVLDGSVDTLNELLDGDAFSLNINGGISGIKFRAKGDITNIMELNGANLEFTTNVGSLADFTWLGVEKLPDYGPFTVHGHIKYDNKENITIKPVSIELGKSVISGHASLDAKRKVPMLNARLKSDEIDISPWFTAKKTKKDKKNRHLFPRGKLSLAPLSAFNAYLTVTADKIKHPVLVLENSRLDINLQDGELLISNVAKAAGGNLDMVMGLRPGKSDNTIMSAGINGSNIMLEHLPPQADPWFTGGSTDITINGQGTGNSFSEIMGHFHGNLLVNVGEATIPDSDINLLGADILFSTFNSVNPFKDETSFLECAVINFAINDGTIKINRQIAMQSSKMHMVASGKINLKEESLKLDVMPYAKEGVGFNLSTFTGAGKIGGTLANPKVEFGAENVLKTGVSAGAAVLTSGLSLLAQGLFSNAGADRHPCDTALEKNSNL